MSEVKSGQCWTSSLRAWRRDTVVQYTPSVGVASGYMARWWGGVVPETAPHHPAADDAQSGP